MTVHKFTGKVVYPVLAAILLFFLLRPFCMGHGKCDYRLLIPLMGIPFGIGKMLVWIVPGRTDLGGILGFLVFQILLGGIIGSLIMLLKLAEAAVYLIWGIYAGILWVYRIRKSGMEE